MIGRTVDQLAVGDSAEISRTVQERDILRFVESVGDRNPIHSDRAFAAGTPFGEPIVPGIWTAGLISAVIGTQLPGPGGIYLSQNLKFLRPVKFGDTITARVEVAEILCQRNRVRLTTSCRNQRGEEVLTGEAWVLPPKVPIQYDEEHTRPPRLSSWMLFPLVLASRMLSFWRCMGASALAVTTPPCTGGRA
jgi:acyl dehydratase